MIVAAATIGCSHCDRGGMSRRSEDTSFESHMEAFTKEFMNRRIYTELNEEVIQGIPDKWLIQAVEDFIGIRIGHDWEHDTEKVPPLGAGFSAIHFVSILDAEVNNGGFNQLFYNNGREAVVYARKGAELLGLEDLASLIEKALTVEQAQRDKMAAVKKAGTLEAFMKSYEDEAFDEFDDQFVGQAPELEKAMIAFIRSHSPMFSGRADDP
ncbi:MAG: DUF4375 domain-containing protein [Verrucomicrobiae bacterium]|nr:DUF4375 domain-containing protein [Verrucomicrobiae bacterium]